MNTIDPSLQISSFEPNDFKDVLIFTDRWIGKNYFSLNDLEEIYRLSCYKNLNASLVARHQKQIVAVRLTLAPGLWIKPGHKGISPHLWPAGPLEMAYLKSLFVHEDFQQLGIGRQLTQRSLNILKEMGARGVLCHSWLESPGNSSQRYLLNMGLNPVANHPLFWNLIDYDCTRCAPNRCVCTAVEMVKLI